MAGNAEVEAAAQLPKGHPMKFALLYGSRGSKGCYGLEEFGCSPTGRNYGEEGIDLLDYCNPNFVKVRDAANRKS